MKIYQHDVNSRLTGQIKRCIAFVGDLKGKQILDIGCSFGWFEQVAIADGCTHIVGIEPDEVALRQTQEYAPKALYIRQRASTLALPDHHFDVVVMFEVIEHLPKHSELSVLAEVRRVLKPCGRLFISTPNASVWSQLLDPAWYFGHRHYSATHLSLMLHQAGFSVIDVQYGGGYWELISMILLYVCKWVFGRELPAKDWFEERRTQEYFSREHAFATVFVEVTPSPHL